MTTTTTTGASLEHRIGAQGRFQLRQISGTIALHGVDGDVVRVRELEGRPLADSFRIDAGDGRLELWGPDRNGIGLVFGTGRRSRPDITVDVPRGATIVIETANAELVADGLRGRTSVRTASGEVELHDTAGILDIDAVSAEVEIDGTGTLELRARTISGDLSVRAAVLRRAEIGTTSGDVRIDARLAGTGPFGIASVSGDATIVARSGLRVEGHTVTGDLRSEVDHRIERAPGRKVLMVGEGAVALAFKSVSGDLRVVRPRDELAPPPAVEVPVPPVAPAAPTASATPTAPAAPAAPAAPSAPFAPARDDERLEVLRAVERGELTVDVAMARLAALEEA